MRMDNHQEVKNNVQKSESLFKRWILPFLCVITVSAFPALFMYFQNADEAKFIEVLSPLLLFIFIGVILFIAFLFISKSTFKSAIIATIFMLILLNYSLLEQVVQKILPNLRYWHILPILLFVVAHITWAICKNMQNELANTITQVLCIVFAGLIAFNMIVASPSIINKMSRENKEEIINNSNSQTQTAQGSTSTPNIYFLLFDEYSTVNFMEKYYDYDNSSFTNYLQKRGFNVSYTSHNESITTSTVLTNYVNMEYIVTDKMSEIEKKAVRHNNLLFKLLKENNYEIKCIGDSEFFGLENTIGKSNNSSKTIGGDTLEILTLDKTFMYPFISRGYSEKARLILDSVEYLKKLKQLPNSGQLTLFYCQSTHTPFVFNENGNELNSGFTNWSDKKYYLGTYIYTTKLITEIVDSILTSDPNSIIVVQSDHSARATMDSDLFTKVYKLEDMNNHFNAVYYHGEHLDISGLSGVNTWRLLASRLFGLNLDKVEVPVDENKY